jgi:hypothetical protein
MLLFSRCIRVAGQKRTNPWSALAAVSDDDDGKNDGLKWKLAEYYFIAIRRSSFSDFYIRHRESIPYYILTVGLYH